MSLTPDDVLNQKFTITKFRDGYDLDQVDDFLDSIVEELRSHEQEKTELQSKIDELTTQLEACEAASSVSNEPEARQPQYEPAPVAAATPAAVATPEAMPAGANVDAVKSSAMLQLALELHDKHVHDGETTRDEMIATAESTAKQLVEEAQKQRSDVLETLGGERNDLKQKIVDLREFESEYRTTLRSYIEAQLRNLEGSPEPDTKPSHLN